MNKKSALRIRENKNYRLRTDKQLKLLTMPKETRRQFVKKVGAAVLKDAKKNIQQQKTISGVAMTKRKNPTNKKKLLRKMGKGLYVKTYGADKSTVGWKGKAGFIAAKHHYGASETMTAQRAKKRDKINHAQTFANRYQAKALIDAGYKKPDQRRASQKWIIANLSSAQAGLILRKLENNTEKKQQWRIDLPARPFLGATQEKAKYYITMLAKRILNKLKK